MGQKVAPPDARVAAIAARQYGVVSIRQLREAGLSDHAVRGRRERGQLHRVHRGVYAVGHPALSFEGRAMAAVLALGDAFVSHRSAAAIWQLLPTAPGPIDISIPSRAGRLRRRNIRIHRPRSLPPEQVTQRRGIPTTSPARIISDLRTAVPPPELRRAIRQAEVLGLPLGEEAIAERTRSELEHLFLELCRSYDLPTPEVNVRIGTRIVDFLWRDRKLIVETDGYRYHRGRAAFEDDRSRDLELRTLGFEVLRLSHRQVSGESARVAAALRDALQAGRLIGDRGQKVAPGG